MPKDISLYRVNIGDRTYVTDYLLDREFEAGLGSNNHWTWAQPLNDPTNKHRAVRIRTSAITEYQVITEDIHRHLINSLKE